LQCEVADRSPGGVGRPEYLVVSGSGPCREGQHIQVVNQFAVANRENAFKLPVCQQLLLPGIFQGKGAALLWSAKNSSRGSRSNFLNPILMMESAENGSASHPVSRRNTMPLSALLCKRT
jgi:hypothetical protein